MLLSLLCSLSISADEMRSRAREISIKPGVLSTGKLNTITDVEGVLVGHVTLIEGRSVRTGATAILPHGGNLYQDKVPAAVHNGNGFGKMMGISQIMELGEIETPIILTNTLAVPRGADAILNWTLNYPGNQNARSVNAVVGETNDGYLNDIRARALTPEIIEEAITTAKPGPVEEGNVGAGTGTVAFSWKGGIGTSSRKLPASLGGYTVGVLVQSNYGGVLNIDGIRVGEALGQFYLQDHLDTDKADGSIMIVVATDAPLSDRNLTRLARRAMAGVARTGASLTNGSGDYVIAFSTHADVRRTPERRNSVNEYPEVPNNLMSPLFQATIEATEESIYNSLLMAEDMESFNVARQQTVTIPALPIDKLKELLAHRER
ncbi:MAG: P1 family peptidase [Kordiimonadaceae bacterium]|nr:P1 family peptidase [Kordiimonadaceae bacterium]MBO6570527.1 P1 family peptidase [Kordiimonadaceae bacterium]MBO6966354.1 P1 family peptidase [Kordiimonadaceae bacterium]